MKKSVIVFTILALSFTSCFAQTVGASISGSGKRTDIDITKLDYAVTDRNAPAVYFSRDISSESILKLYRATGKKLTGKTALKVIFEEPGEQYLDPKLLTGLVKETNGTFIDSLYLTSRRGSVSRGLDVAKLHGYTAVAPCEIIDAEGELNLPVKNGNILKYHRVGKGFAKYDSAVAVMLFKPHHFPQYDGISKALSIPFATKSGKYIIHSGGKIETHFTSGDDTEFQLAIADSMKASSDYLNGNWVYITVLADITTDDSCSVTAPGNIGVLASTDPVAIDRAACDMTFGQGTDAQTARWNSMHGVDTVLNGAEKIGVGKQHYRIIEVK